MATKAKRKSTKKIEKVQLNFKVAPDFKALVNRNAKRKDMTPTRYIQDLVRKDGWGLDNTEITAINTQLHTIDNWQRKIFFTTDSLAKLFMRYIYEEFKYMPIFDEPEYEAAAKGHGIEKYKQFMNDYRAAKNFYKRSFLEQMFKAVVETTSDFEKLNPMKAPDKDNIVKKRYYYLIRHEIENLNSIFAPNELDFIAILCHEIEWNEVKDIKGKLLKILLEASEIEMNQSGLDRDELGEKISKLTQIQLFAMTDYIEGYCDLNCLTPIKENELFKKMEA